MTKNIIRLERAIVKFGGSLSVDGYRTPDGEFRVGMTGAGLLLGFTKAWLGRAIERQGDTLRTLNEYGFSGDFVKGKVDGRTGLQNVSTISLDDFALLILYAASKGKKEAIALQLAFTKMSLNDFFREAFGEPQLTMKEEHKLFYKDYGKTIDWLEEDLKDFKIIEEQLRFVEAI